MSFVSHNAIFCANVKTRRYLNEQDISFSSQEICKNDMNNKRKYQDLCQIRQYSIRSIKKKPQTFIFVLNNKLANYDE